MRCKEKRKNHADIEDNSNASIDDAEVELTKTKR